VKERRINRLDQILAEGKISPINTMSVLKPRQQGKGDGRRDNFKSFQAAFEDIKRRDNPLTGKLFLKKNNRTIVKYK
jgi:hypothetical protein